MKTKMRSKYIDILKGLLITLVVIGHLPFFEYNSRTLTLIYSFHMPAFLIIGGILSHNSENTTFSEIFLKRFTSIIVPYFIFYFVSMVFMPAESFEKRAEGIIVMFKGIGISPDNAVNLPLWFLTYYFVAMTIFEWAECLFYKIKKLLFGKSNGNNNKKLFFVEFFTLMIISIIMYFAYYYARIYKGVRMPFNIEIACFSLGFVFVGKIFGLTVPSAIKEIKKSIPLSILLSIVVFLFLLILFIYWYFLSMKNGRIDLNARDYKNAFYMYFDAIIGFVLFAFFAKLVSFIPLINNLFSLLGKNSIYILAYHVPSTLITHNIIVPLFPGLSSIISNNSLLSIFILTSFGIIFSLIMSLIHKAIKFPAK